MNDKNSSASVPSNGVSQSLGTPGVVFASGTAGRLATLVIGTTTIVTTTTASTTMIVTLTSTATAPVVVGSELSLEMSHVDSSHDGGSEFTEETLLGMTSEGDGSDDTVTSTVAVEEGIELVENLAIQESSYSGANESGENRACQESRYSGASESGVKNK